MVGVDTLTGVLRSAGIGDWTIMAWFLASDRELLDGLSPLVWTRRGHALDIALEFAPQTAAVFDAH